MGDEREKEDELGKRESRAGIAADIRQGRRGFNHCRSSAFERGRRTKTPKAEMLDFGDLSQFFGVQPPFPFLPFSLLFLSRKCGFQSTVMT